jgi:hypothetical protein
MRHGGTHRGGAATTLGKRKSTMKIRMRKRMKSKSRMED